jgi:hypothetical protein
VWDLQSSGTNGYTQTVAAGRLNVTLQVTVAGETTAVAGLMSPYDLAETTRYTGVITQWCGYHYGWLKPDQSYDWVAMPQRVWVPLRECPQCNPLKEGTRVSFLLQPDRRGLSAIAKNVLVIPVLRRRRN